MRDISKAQGATEYLVLLAVVLIIALVAIALLGFFPGTANDAQIAESQIYWQSASPVAIIETAAQARTAFPAENVMYLRIRNTGAYPLRLTKMLGDKGESISQVWGAGGASMDYQMSDYYYLAPGEEKNFGGPSYSIAFELGAGSTGHELKGLTARCNSVAPYGTLEMKNFGFEYIQYVENQQITKRQVGTKSLLARCKEPY